MEAATAEKEVVSVYGMIAEVSSELARSGIAKDRQNKQQGYAFRGIDDVYNTLAPILSRVGLVILPRVLRREVSERKSNSGGVIFAVVVEAEFDFVSSLDGSKHVVRTFGEAMDSGDKATNKAMSAAYKYAAFQAFCIPTEGDNDADATTQPTIAPTKPEGYDAFVQTLKAQLPSEIKLRHVFAAATVGQREYLTTTDAKLWAEIKAGAR